MRNFKKLLSVVVVIAMMLTLMVPVFAEGPGPKPAAGAAAPVAAAPAGVAESKVCTDLGMLIGEGGGVTPAYLAQTPTRIQAAIMFLRLKGLEAEAKAFTGADNFADANKTPWAKPYMAYLKANKNLGWIGDGTNFNADAKLDAQQYYKVILEALGYKEGADFQYADTIKFAAEKGLVKAATGAFTVNSIAVATVEGLKAAVKGGTTTLVAKLVADGKLTAAKVDASGIFPGVASVSSVVATSAKGFAVTFTKAVADTAKVAIAVKRSTTAMTMTTTWNADKTVATVASSAVLPEGSYTIEVKDGDTVVGTSTVAITAQKLAKIEITSTKLAVTTDGDVGYASYKVSDQYNNDITSSYLAANIDFRCAAGTAEGSNGLLTVNSDMSLNYFLSSGIVVTASDLTSGIATTATLAIATGLGTLSDFKFGATDKLKLVDGDTTTTFNIPYTATDVSGNPTSNFELVSQGLMLTDYKLNVSSSYVEAKVIEDPTNTTNALIQVKVIDSPTDGLGMDLPIAITAMTYTGKVATINTTLYKANAVTTLTLLAPAEVIAVGDAGKTVPFEAFDQAGNKVTKYADLYNKVSLNGDISWAENVDGTAKIVLATPTDVETLYLSANVDGTISYSSLTLKVQEAAVPDSIAIDYNVFKPAMEDNATQGLGMNAIIVKDQYSRTMNMFYPSDRTLKVRASVSGSADITADGTATGDIASFTEQSVNILADNVDGGTATLTLKLYQDAGTTGLDDDDTVYASMSTTLTIVKLADIVDYTIEAKPGDLFASPDTYATDLTTANAANDRAYGKKIEVYGKTSGGTRVVLAGQPVSYAMLDNAADFAITTMQGGAYTAGANGPAFRVTAGKLAADKTASSTLVTASIYHNGKISTKSLTVTSSSVPAKAQNVVAELRNAKNWINGVEVKGEDVNITLANFAVGNYLSIYDMVSGAAAATTGSAVNAGFVFRVEDQYKNGTAPDAKGSQPMMIKVVSGTNAAGTALAAADLITVNTNGTIAAPSSARALAVGDVYEISAVSNNGLVKTVRVTIVSAI